MSDPNGTPFPSRPDFEPPVPGQPVPQPPLPGQPLPGQPVPGPSHPGPVYPPISPGQVPGAPEPGPLPGPLGPDPLAAQVITDVRPPENVGRGVLFSLLGIVVGAVASVLIYQAGFLASITSFLMAVAVGWLYTKGAGAPPRAGAFAVVGVILVGVVVSLFSMLGVTLYTEIAADYPGAPFGDIMAVVFDNLFYPPIWAQFGGDAAMFVLFAVLGTLGTLLQLRRASSGK